MRIHLDALPPRASPEDAEAWYAAAAPLLEGVGWVKAFAWVNFVLAGIFALSIVGLCIAWIFAWVGYLFWGMAKQLEQAHRAHDPWALSKALDHCAIQFVVQAVAMGVIAVIEVLVVVGTLMGG